MRIWAACFALCALLIGQAAPARAQDTIKVGVAAEPYPPFTTPDAAGNWSGWEIDIMHAVCAKADLNCVITPIAWDGIIPALTSQKIDVIMSSMSITAEREQTIDFSDKYMNAPAVVVVAKGSGIKATPESLAGKIVGVQSATTHANYVKKHFAGTAAEVKEYQTQDEANQDLAAGRVDATEQDAVAAQAFLDSEQGQCCENAGVVAADPEILGRGVGIGLRKGDTALKDRLNKAIAAIRADGSYDQISKKYFSFDIYGD